MKIISLTFSEVSAVRKSVPKAKMEVKNNLNIVDIIKEEVDLSPKPALRFDFSYDVNFEPGIAKITLKGSVVAIDENNESQEILKAWKKKQFTDPIKLPMFNLILSKCNLRSIELEDQLGIPFHIPFPQINGDSKNPASESKKPVNYTG